MQIIARNNTKRTFISQVSQEHFITYHKQLMINMSLLFFFKVSSIMANAFFPPFYPLIEDFLKPPLGDHLQRCLDRNLKMFKVLVLNATQFILEGREQVEITWG